MKVVTIYIADDGREFKTEDECYEYELRQRTADAKIQAFNDKLILVNWRTDMNDIQFIHFGDFESLCAFNDVMEDMGYTTVPCYRETNFAPWWEWDSTRCEYVKLDLDEVYNRYMTLKALWDKCADMEGETNDGE